MLRVDLPRSLLGLFTERPGGGEPPRAPLVGVAAALGYDGPADLRAALAGNWSGWSSLETVSAAELLLLIQLLQTKRSRVHCLLQELMRGGSTTVVNLPSYPAACTMDTAAQAASVTRLPSNGASEPPLPPPWPMCDPEDVGMDREVLEKCRRYLRYRIGRQHFAGIVGGVVKNGKLVYFDEAGYADVASKSPMRQDTLIRLFSMTKCIVVVAFLVYAEDPAFGIDLDDPVWKYIPSFKQAKLAPKRGSTKPRDLDTALFTPDKPSGNTGGKPKPERLPAAPTLRQLLTHTAGFGYGPTFGDSWPPKPTDHYKIYQDLLEKTDKGQLGSLAEWVDALAKVPLKVRPGSYWEYSFATDVLGRVLEVVSGKPLDQVVEEKVCAPLGMVDTCFRVPAEKISRMGAWYEKRAPVDEKGVPIEKPQTGAKYQLSEIDKAGENSGWFTSNCSTILSGGGSVDVPLSIKGGMVSTFRDYLRFLLMIRNMGELDGVRLLRKETVQLMLCNQLPAATGRRAAWVFDKKGQGFNFMGQVQVQHMEKDTFQEKGELKRGNMTYASLAPGTVSAEFGWGGLGGPAWTIDPRLDLIILSMTQTALELDHEENLRFAARRGIHAGIFGPTAGPTKVTDYPPESHEGLKGGQLRLGLDGAAADPTELSAFLEAEQQAQGRGMTLKELAVARGNTGHEVLEEDVDQEADPKAATESETGDNGSAAGVAADAENSDARRGLVRKGSSEGSDGCAKVRRTGSDAGDSPKQPEALGAPSIAEKESAASTIADGDNLLFRRVQVDDPSSDAVHKARVTKIDGGDVEVVVEGNWQAMSLPKDSVALIDESRMGTSTRVNKSPTPKDFSFLMPQKNNPKSK